MKISAKLWIAFAWLIVVIQAVALKVGFSQDSGLGVAVSIVVASAITYFEMRWAMDRGR